MESDLTPQEPTAEQAAPSAVSAEPSAQPTAGESGRQEQPSPDAVAQGMNAFMRGELGAPAVTSKPADAAPSGESAPAEGDVEAGQSPPPRGPDGKFLPRRGAAEAVRTAEERIADLERQLAERDPEKLREQILAEQATEAATASDEAQARADAERYERLRDLPDRDLSDEDYRWREERKALLASFPAARRALLAEAERTAEAKANGLLNTVAADVYATATEYGIDAQKWAPGTGATFRSMTKDVVEHVAAPLRERIAELERELHSARSVGPNGIGSVRVPALAGRSDGGAKPKTMDDFLRYG